MVMPWNKEKAISITGIPSASSSYVVYSFKKYETLFYISSLVRVFTSFLKDGETAFS